MKLFPAIDLYEGQAVRLVKGDYAQKTVYSADPAAVARGFEAAGARYIHLVDLEGARDGTTPNFPVVASILRQTGLRAQIGGGIRSPQVVRAYLEAGAMRVILGTAALENPEFLRDMVSTYGEKIAVGVDLKGEYVATRGWRETTGRTWKEFFSQLEALGVRAVICTDIARDGLLAGTNLSLYARLLEEFPRMEIIASGGVSCLEDVLALRDMGMPGAILGKALYEKRLDLAAALAACPREEESL